MKHLKKFATETDYQTFLDSDDYAEPNISLVKAGGLIKYNVRFAGVGIQHINGKIYSVGKWINRGFSNDEANGVAVKTDTHSFVISKNKLANSIAWSSVTSTAVDGVLLTTDQTIAKSDIRGNENTAKILETATSGAAYMCGNYTFPNGGKGYLPALGELAIAIEYHAEISAAMQTIGGALVSNTGKIWSSTQYSNANAWFYSWSNKTINQTSKSNYVNMGVIPFTTLD